METIDTTVLDGRVKVKQPVAGGLRVTMDTIFVSAACPAKSGERIADFGAGTGAAGLCAAARVSGVHVTFVEIQSDYADLCVKNAAMNNLTAEALCTDIRDLKGHAFDHIVCNPPYLEEGTHYTSPDPKRQKAVGNGAGDAALGDWIAAAARNLKPQGTFSLIHRADALGEILTTLTARKFGAIEIWPLHPWADKDANRVVIRAALGRKTSLKLHPAVILHTDRAQKYSDQAEKILSDAQIL